MDIRLISRSLNSEDHLHQYQRDAIDFALRVPKCGLYLDAGLGKTLTTLHVIKHLLENPKVTNILIIAPKEIVENTWSSEIAKWKDLSHLTYSIIKGTVKQKIKALTKRANIHIISRDSLNILKSTKKITWDLIVLDESSSFKNQRTLRFKTLSKINYNRMIQLSATPRPRCLLDLWAQIKLLDNGERLFKSMSKYKSAYFFQKDRFVCFVRKECIDIILDKISDITLSMKKEDYLQLPDLININHIVNNPQKELYNRLKNKRVITIGDTTILAAKLITARIKLMQMANGFIYDDNKNSIKIHTAKIDALKAIIESASDENILVAYAFQSDLNAILNTFPQAEEYDSKKDSVIRWNNGKIKLLAVHPAKCGKGLNLQAGGNIIVWFGLPQNYEDYYQLVCRLHRQGQTLPVRVYHIITEGTIDEAIMQDLSEKSVGMNYFMNYLKHDERIKEKD
jgi:SNF2 family DNA or RNA helicase